MIYAAAAWHMLKRLIAAKENHVKQLELKYNGFLRKVLGAYRVISVRVLKTEVEVTPIRLTLDEIVLRC